MKILSVFLVFLLTACYSGYDLKPVSYYQLFHDGNSKVWLVDQMIVEDSSISPKENKMKNVFVFHESGDFQFAPLKNLAGDSLATGTYLVDSKDRKLSMYINNEKWEFDLAYIEEDSVLLTPGKESETKYSFKIIPLPML